VFVANGSHAAYFVPGTRDRMWPDPNDEADGRGTVVHAPVERVDERSPAWMRFPGPWGGARALGPGRGDLPRGASARATARR
jgi:hypothetical protein